MNQLSPLPAALAYLPVLGWLYVFFLQRQNQLAVFHLRQSIGLFLFLLATLLVWAVVAWLLVWIPLMAVVSVALFTLVIAAYLYGFVAWLLGIFNALRSRQTPLPGFGGWASRLPIH